MDLSSYRHSGSISISKPPEAVYAIISDVTRIGELSPVCKSGAWDDGAQAGKEGAWFTGHNVLGSRTWDTHCKVVAAAPGREFTFVNHGPGQTTELVRWGYTFEPEGNGTKVTETWQVLPAYPDFVTSADPNADVKARIDGMAKLAQDGIQETLANLKRIAES
jgi:carbon monoxide dehydrogenase subunit G